MFRLHEEDISMPVHRRSDNGAWEVLIHPEGRAPIRRSNKAWSQYDALKAEQELLAAPHFLEEGLDKWIADYLPRLSCRENYKSKAELLRPLLKDKLMIQGPTVVAEARKLWHDVKPATINRRLAILRRILHLAYDEWHWLELPLHGKIKLLPENNKRHYYLTRADVERLRVACPDPRVANLIVFSAFTGLRMSEMFRTTAAHVIDKDLHVPSETKNDEPRVVPLHPNAAAIAQHLPYKDMNDWTLRKAWEAARIACLLEHIHWHDLRHTFASWVLQGGAALVDLQVWLGHKNISQTMRYAHLEKKHNRGVIDNL